MKNKLYNQTKAVMEEFGQKTIGEATVVAAQTRPKFIGGVRATYNETLL